MESKKVKFLKYCILVTKTFEDQLSHIAWKFSKKLISCNHKIEFIFFYHFGVYNSNNFIKTFNNELNIVKLWSELHVKNKVNLYVCISSALRRGITHDAISFKHDKKVSNLHKSFKFSSLEFLINNIDKCDKFIQF